MSEKSAYGWPWFRKEIQDGVAFSERYCADLLDLVEEIDSIVGAIFSRPMSPLSDRPQDYVVSILAARAFRLMVSSLYIGLGGYPDSATNLERTVWEISIRLLDITTAPAAAAFGFLLDGAMSEISHVQAELNHRRANGKPVHLLPENQRRLQAHYEALERVVRDRGLDPDQVRRTHGRLNIREVCKRFGVEKAYLVDYALASEYVHEKNAASSDYVVEKEDQRQFHLGPVGTPGGPATVAIDLLMNMARVLRIATRIVEEEEIVKWADEVLQKVITLRNQHITGPIWPTV